MATFVGASGATASSVVELTISKPAGVVAGDLMLAFVSQQAGVATIAPPEGWAEAYRAVDSAQEVICWVRTAVSDSSWTWTRSQVGKITGHIVAYRHAEVVGSATLDSPGTANSWITPTVAYPDGRSGLVRLDVVAQRSSTPATLWTVPSNCTARDARYTVAAGATYSVAADSAPTDRPSVGGTYSNDGVASSATAMISLVLADPVEVSPVEGSHATIWTGTEEQPVTLTLWDGTSEHPVSLSSWDGTTEHHLT